MSLLQPAPLGYQDYPGGRALIVTHDDGWIEVFGCRALDVHCITMPKVATGNEQTAEQLIESMMPKRFRPLYFPGYLRATHIIETVTPLDLAKRSADIELLRVLDNIEKAGKPSPPNNGGKQICVA